MLNVINRLANKDNSAAGDYIQDGVLICGKCHTPKQTMKELPKPDGGTASRLVPIMCRCERETQAELSVRDEKRRFALWIAEQQGKYGISDSSYRTQTFDLDDRRNARISNTCRRYVER